MINAEIKGKRAEQEIVKELNDVIKKLHKNDDTIDLEKYFVHRNLAQTAQGGDDIVNIYGLSLEIKRCEELRIEDWWRQACKSAGRKSAEPVLIYKQNKKSWRVLLMTELSIYRTDAVLSNSRISVRAEISFKDFLRYFEELVRFQIYRRNDVITQS
jgi:hypothetical protein